MVSDSLRYMYHKLGGSSGHRVRRRLAKLNGEIETVTKEIELLSLIRDNRLQYSVYKPFVDRTLAGMTRNKKRGAKTPTATTLRGPPADQ